MNAQDFINLGIGAVVVYIVVAQLRLLRDLKNVAEEVKTWKSWLDRDITRAQEGVYANAREMASGFEELGLLRRPARTTGPVWVKPEPEQQRAITGGR